MKKLLLITLLFTTWTAYGQQGRVLESRTIKSKLLGKDVKYNVYLPADFDKSERAYPVLYLLHGYSDDETSWTQFGEVQTIADKAINEGSAAPMIIVMPDAGVSWYLNSYDGKTRYEDFFVTELIPTIEATFRARPKKEFRAIAGLSMGGYGTLLLSTKHPELFAAAAPLSAAVWTDSEVVAMPEQRWNGFMAQLFGKDLKGEARLNDHWQKNSILKIVETTPLEKLKTVRFYIDCGDDDFLIKGNMALHAAMIDKSLPHEFRVRDGGHSWGYWRTSLPDVLKFISQSFHR
jgi:S-formylglutathione hydrolase FrmB